MKRFNQQHIETPIARLIIAGQLADGAEVEVKVENGALTVQ